MCFQGESLNVASVRFEGKHGGESNLTSLKLSPPVRVLQLPQIQNEVSMEHFQRIDESFHKMIVTILSDFHIVAVGEVVSRRQLLLSPPSGKCSSLLVGT